MHWPCQPAIDARWQHHPARVSQTTTPRPRYTTTPRLVIINEVDENRSASEPLEPASVPKMMLPWERTTPRAVMVRSGRLRLEVSLEQMTLPTTHYIRSGLWSLIKLEHWHWETVLPLHTSFHELDHSRLKPEPFYDSTSHRGSWQPIMYLFFYMSCVETLLLVTNSFSLSLKIYLSNHLFTEAPYTRFGIL
jgi:hypothetical protein